MCSVNNEAVLLALFKINADKLTFNTAIKDAIETEDSVKVAKETVYGSVSSHVYKVKSFKQEGKMTSNSSNDKTTRKCYRCSKASHLALKRRFKTATCGYCKSTRTPRIGRLQKYDTSKGTGKVQSIESPNPFFASPGPYRLPCKPI